MSLTVTGKNLDCVSRPRLYVNLLHEEKKYDDVSVFTESSSVLLLGINLRPRKHPFLLPPKDDRYFVSRVLFK